MQRYNNRGGDSGISAFELGSDYITVKFSGTIRTYKYSYRKAGKNHVENMKKLVLNGSGLNSYINNYTKKLYD